MKKIFLYIFCIFIYDLFILYIILHILNTLYHYYITPHTLNNFKYLICIHFYYRLFCIEFIIFIITSLSLSETVTAGLRICELEVGRG